MPFKTFVRLSQESGGDVFVDPMLVSSVRDDGRRGSRVKIRFAGDSSKSLVVTGRAESIQNELLAAVPEDVSR